VINYFLAWIRYRLALAAPTCTLWELKNNQYKFKFGDYWLLKDHANFLYSLTHRRYVEYGEFMHYYLKYHRLLEEKEFVKLYITNSSKIIIRDMRRDNKFERVSYKELSLSPAFVAIRTDSTLFDDPEYQYYIKNQLTCQLADFILDNVVHLEH